MKPFVTLILFFLLTPVSYGDPCFPEIDSLPCGFKRIAQISIAGQKEGCRHIKDLILNSGKFARLVYSESEFVSIVESPLLAGITFIYSIDEDKFFFSGGAVRDKPITKNEACKGIEEIFNAIF